MLRATNVDTAHKSHSSRKQRDFSTDGSVPCLSVSLEQMIVY